MDGGYAELAVNPRISIRHRDGARLMACRDEIGTRGYKGVGDCKVAAAKQTENTLYTI